MRSLRAGAAAGLAVLLTVLVAAAGCGLLGGGRNEALDGSWELFSFGDAAGPVVDDAGMVPTMTLDAGEVTGHSGVNQFGGSYTWSSDGAFQLEDVTRTAVGGTEEQMAVEQTFFDALEAVRRYEVADTRLRLSDDQGGDLLVFDPKGPGDR